MHRPYGILFLWLFSLVSSPLAQLQLEEAANSEAVFGGTNRSLRIMVRNPTRQTVVSEISIRLFQASAALAIPVDSSPWKTLQVLPGQTIVETLRLSFPK